MKFGEEETSVTYHHSYRSEADPSELASRLRSLRLHRWPDQVVRQPDLGRALGAGTSSVSSWEDTDAPKLPSEDELRGYATFFASPRSLGSHPPRLLRDDELTDEERGERDKLFAELRNLRAAAAGEDKLAANAQESGKPRRKRRRKRTGLPTPALQRGGETRLASPLPENSPGQGTGGLGRDLRDLIALLLILAVPTILIIVGNVGAAVIVAASQFVVAVLLVWWRLSGPRSP